MCLWINDAAKGHLSREGQGAPVDRRKFAPLLSGWSAHGRRGAGRQERPPTSEPSHNLPQGNRRYPFVLVGASGLVEAQPVDMLSVRARWLTCLAVLGVFAGLVSVVQPREGPPEPATWRVGGRLDRSSTELHLRVQERSCASGMTANGRIEPPEVTYGDEQVIIAIRVRPKGGDVDCQSNPETPLTVRLREPVGTRAVVDGAALPPVTVVEPG